MLDALPRDLQAVYDETRRCNNCGFCQPTCPIYQATGKEGSVARGHHAHVRNLVEGKLSLTKDLKPALFECLLCRACVANCFPAVRTDKVIVAARAAYRRRFGQPTLEKFVFRHVMQHPSRMSRYVRLALLGKRLGFSGAANKLGLLPLLSKRLSLAESLMEEPPSSFLADRIPELSLEPSVSPPKQRIAYFMGCGLNFGLPQTGQATLEALVALGNEVQVVDNYCCGLPPYVYGDTEAALSLAKKNLDRFRELEAEAIVTDCATCYSHLKQYCVLLADDPDYADQATAFSYKVAEASDYAGSGLRPEQLSPLEGIVTYHDPCHLSRYEVVTEPPRRLLQAIPDLEYRELPEADWCCGGAGVYNIMHPEQSMHVLERKMRNVRKTGASILATSCPACIIQLSYGARVLGVDVEVLHVMEVLARAARGASPDAAG